MPSVIDWEALLAAATAVRTLAHAPYSRFLVGAALLADDGTVWTGCNVENRTFGLTVCAERVAVGNAVSNGRRRFVAIAIVTASSPPAAPCGLCRETLAEFASDLPVLVANVDGDRELLDLAGLLPRAFVLPADR